MIHPIDEALLLLTPSSIWRRTHHYHNSRLQKAGPGLAVALRSLKCPRKPRSNSPPGSGNFPMTDQKLPDAGEQSDD